MILYLDRSEVPDVERVPSEVLRSLIRKGEQAAGRYDKLWRYYLGQHTLPTPAGRDEVQVVVNYAKYVVDIALGYYLSHPVKYDANQTDALGRKIDLTPLIHCYDQAQVQEADLTIGKTMGVMGDCLELCYSTAGEHPGPASAVIDPRSGILVKDNTVEHAKLFGLI